MSDQRCPRCGAARRPGDQWCGLCYADFRERPEVVGDVTAPAPPEGAAPAAPTAPAGDAGQPPLIRPPDSAGVRPPSPPAPSQPAPAIPAQVTTPAAASGSSFLPSANPLAAVDAATAPAEAPSDPPADPKWPCPRCGALVPMSEDNCPACGAGFLADAVGVRVQVPLVGDVGKMNAGQKLMFGTAIAVGIIIGILVLLTIGAKLT